MYLPKTAVAVGSRVWGGATNESDYDFIIPTEEKDEVLERNKGNTIESEYEDRKTVYVEDKGKKYNFIFLNEESFKAWERASEMMKAYPHLVLTGRNKRVFLFKMLVNTFIFLTKD